MFIPKKISLISSFLLFSLFLGANLVFARELEVQLPGEGAPTTTSVLLTDYVRYIFNFIIAISGFIIFGVIVFSGVQLLTQAQNPGALGEAKSRIFDAIIGLIVIFGAYVLLTTINPQIIIGS